MNVHDAAEQAYRNGYAKGYADAKKNEKHGRWLPHKPDCRGYTAGFACSCCRVIVYTDYSMKECEYDYCPNCGAIMDLPNITENTRKALEKMGENVHSEIDFDYAAED